MFFSYLYLCFYLKFLFVILYLLAGAGRFFLNFRLDSYVTASGVRPFAHYALPFDLCVTL